VNGHRTDIIALGGLPETAALQDDPPDRPLAGRDRRPLEEPPGPFLPQPLSQRLRAGLGAAQLNPVEIRDTVLARREAASNRCHWVRPQAQGGADSGRLGSRPPAWARSASSWRKRSSEFLLAPGSTGSAPPDPSQSMKGWHADVLAGQRPETGVPGILGRKSSAARKFKPAGQLDKRSYGDSGLRAL